MLASLVEWHMRKAWAPRCYTDTEPDETGDPVLPSRRSEPALTRVLADTLPDGSGAHSFRSLHDSRSTIVRSSHSIAGSDDGRGTIVELTNQANASQKKALDLLKDIAAV
ncbi:MAG: hypothetical protein OXF56_03725 [Rhodobacteraceae bacterium]|nr:hypothetical protein [Paracoccaceae bacterium]